MNRKFFRVIIPILIVMEFISVFLAFKAYSNKEVINIKEEYKVVRKKFAMFVKQDGFYVEYTGGDVFPNGYKLNLDKSSCVDTTGKVIGNVLSYNNEMITITSNKTAYCYLYFDIPSTALTADTMPNEITELWDSPLEGDGYRYVGSDPDNYICFGTQNQERCIEEYNTFLYRIIGIFEDSAGDKHLKLVKNTSIEDIYWHPEDIDVDWDNSNLFNRLNENMYGEGSSEVPNEYWANKIATWDYTVVNTLTEEGGPDYTYISVSDVYLHEMNRNTKTSSIGEWKTVTAKIGLMYVSDYVLGVGSEGLDYQWPDNRASWTNNYSMGWSMSRYGYYSDSAEYRVWMLGGFSEETQSPTSVYPFYPVLYLKSDVEIVGGTGILEDPYIIGETE